MQFSVIFEAQLADPTVDREHQLIHDCVEQAVLAEEMGFDRVWAVDLNPRAVAFTRWNAQFNGLANVECLHGDLFEPDPFVLFGDAPSPYCWYGLNPTLFDGPSRSIR